MPRFVLPFRRSCLEGRFLGDGLSWFRSLALVAREMRKITPRELRACTARDHQVLLLHRFPHLCPAEFFSSFHYIIRSVALPALLVLAAVADLAASLDTRALGGAEGEPVHKEIVLREINHRILDRPPAKA